jgi:hypothetical protein
MNQHDYDNFRAAYYLGVGIFHRKTKIFPTKLYLCRKYFMLLRSMAEDNIFYMPETNIWTYDGLRIYIVEEEDHIGFSI